MEENPPGELGFPVRSHRIPLCSSSLSRNTGPTTRASEQNVQEIPPPIRLRTSLLDLALHAETRGSKRAPGATALPDDCVDVPPTTGKSAIANPSKLIPYVEVPRLPSTARDADKVKSAAKRRKRLQERDARDVAEYGGLRRYDTPAVYRILKGAQQVELDIDLDFDVSNKEERVFPVASTGWTGTRVTHTDEERQPHDLQWFMRRHFRYIQSDGRFVADILDPDELPH